MKNHLKTLLVLIGVIAIGLILIGTVGALFGVENLYCQLSLLLFLTALIVHLYLIIYHAIN